MDRSKKHTQVHRMYMSCFLIICFLVGMVVPGKTEEEAASLEAQYRSTYAAQLEEVEKRAITQKEFNAHLKRLKEMGFYVARIVDRTDKNYTQAIRTAISVYAQCMGLPAVTEFTPLIRALLLDEELVIQPYFTPVYTFPYYEGTGNGNRNAYTDKQLQKMVEGNKCVIEGNVTSVEEQPNAFVRMVVATAEGGEYAIEYSYPNRSTRFVKGDSIIAYGHIQSKEETLFVLAADLIGLK